MFTTDSVNYRPAKIDNLIMGNHSIKFSFGSPFFWTISFSIIFIVKALIIFLVIPQLHQLFPGLYSIPHFADGYDRIAINLINGNGYRFYPETAETMMRPPGYVLLLAGIFKIFGHHIIAVQLANVILGILTAYVVIKLTQKVTDSNTCGFFAPLLFLFHPGTILAETRGGVESLLAFFFAAFMLLLYKAIESNRHWDFLFAGMIFGGMLLVKNTPMLFLPLLLPYFYFRKPGLGIGRSTIVLFIVMLGGVCLVYSPWILRNYSITGEFAPTMTVKGAASYMGLHVNRGIFSSQGSGQLMSESATQQNAFAKQLGLTFKPGFFQHFYTSRDELIFDKMFFKKVMEEYWRSPALLFRSISFNFFQFWFLGKSHKSTLLNTILTVPFLTLVILGIRVGYKKKIKITPLLIFIGAYILPHLLILAIARYYVPLIPLLSILVCMMFLKNDLRCSLEKETMVSKEGLQSSFLRRERGHISSNNKIWT